jgi:hypothetical protein
MLHTNANKSGDAEKFDIVLFCHSMYGIKAKHKFMESALALLLGQQNSGLVVIFHHDEKLRFCDSTCHRTSSFPTGVVRVVDDDNVLDQFSIFIAGHVMHGDTDEDTRIEWPEICRSLSWREDIHPNQLLFSSPNTTVAFTKHANTLPELTSKVPLVCGDKIVKTGDLVSDNPCQ